MKRDYYSDIKLVERLIFQNSAYLLTMLDKKVDSFTSQKTPNMRIRERNDFLNPDNVLHPDAPKSLPNPLATLAKDLTKPIWNCITRVQPVAICGMPQKSFTEVQQMVSLFNHIMIRFLQRFKSQHQDEGSIKIHLNLLNRQDNINCLIQQIAQNKPNKTQNVLQQLFQLFLKANQLRMQQIGQQNYYQHLKTDAQATKYILEKIILKNFNENPNSNIQLIADVTSFADIISEYIKKLIESCSGPLYINYSLKNEQLPLLIHPLMLGIYSCIKDQIGVHIQKQKQKNSKTQVFQLPQIQDKAIFQELPTYNCSKITFLNLDGFETPLNILLAKHLSKYLQYISFPQEESYLANDPNLSSYFTWRSQMLARQFVANQLDENGTVELGKLFKQENCEKDLLDYYKRLLVVPVGSIYLSAKDSKGGLPAIQGYQSNFIAFVMKELLYNQIREFGPSVIIISHANTLSILPHHFQQMLSQLSMINNMKIIFYNNLTHTVLPYMLPQESKAATFLNIHRLYSLSYQKQKWPIYKGASCPMNSDLLERAAMFLKICSGTVNLSREEQGDQKYQNYKIMGYAGALLKIISKKHPTIDRLKHRFTQYIKIDKMFFNYFCQLPLSVYHQNLLNQAEKRLISQYGLQTASSDYWKSFLIQYSHHLHLQKQKEETKYFTKMQRPNKYIGSRNNVQDQIIALQFDIQSQSDNQPLAISKNSQIIISSNGKYFPCPVFLLNHSPNMSHPTLNNYVGIIDQTIQNSCQRRVLLREVQFIQHVYKLNAYQHFTQFNYYETGTSVILFWPLLYDATLAVTNNFQRKKYQPQITQLIFIGLKTDLTKLVNMKPINESYRFVHPRIGCTCYQPENSKNIYIFGGFYTNLANYCDFQTDISVLRINEHYQTVLQNIPKTFYLNYTKGFQPDSYFITGINNDFVRPRVQYQVYELPQESMGNCDILLLGGVGEKYTRPFSLIGYMAHLIRFQGQAISNIKRIKLNNVVPANLSRPIKSRTQNDIGIIKSAQNRRIHTTQGTISPGTLTFASFTLKYMLQDERIPQQKRTPEYKRMTYVKQYELGLEESSRQIEGSRQTNMLMMRVGSDSRLVKTTLRHYAYRGSNEASLVLSFDGDNHSILGLGLQLQDNVAQKFVNLEGNKIPLASSHIIAADTIALQIFALICHQEYTDNRIVLARSTYRSIQQLCENEGKVLSLNEIYCFDGQYRKHVIKAMEGEQVAVLHGCHFYPNTRYPECLLRKKGAYYNRQQIRSSQGFEIIKTAEYACSQLLLPNKRSFFLYMKDKDKLVCVSFLSVGRPNRYLEQILVILEELSLSQPNLAWVVRNQCVMDFQLVNIPLKSYEIQQQPQLLPPKQIIDLRIQTDQELRSYTTILTCQGFVFRGIIELQSMLQSLGRTRRVICELMHAMGEEEGLQEMDYECERMRVGPEIIYAKCINKEQKGEIIAQQI